MNHFLREHVASKKFFPPLAFVLLPIFFMKYEI